jgi:hypothetical protein
MLMTIRQTTRRQRPRQRQIVPGSRWTCRGRTLRDDSFPTWNIVLGEEGLIYRVCTTRRHLYGSMRLNFDQLAKHVVTLRPDL